MAQTISVPFTVFWDSGLAESYDATAGATATVKFLCAWNDHYTLVQELTGTASYTVPSGGGAATIISDLPYQYPGSPNLYCRAINSIEPFGAPLLLSWLPKGAWLSRKQALVTAQFSYFPFQGSAGQSGDASGKPLTSTSIQASAEIATIPDFSLVFPDGVPNSTPFPIIVPQAQITLKRYMLPYIPVMEIFSILGGVNGAPVQLGNFTCPTGTVLFCGGTTEVTLNSDGTVLQTADYAFMYRQYPWNFAIHPVNGDWELITNRAGNSPYPTVDFSVLP
ncbi:MAG: hypothetical protein P4L84_02265 [Isosphaeraceae bacterium]|nr:hypothetical protein [Isosphaeraceae bacterium]